MGLLGRRKRRSEVMRVARCSRRWLAKALACSAGETALGGCGCVHSVPPKFWSPCLGERDLRSSWRSEGGHKRGGLSARKELILSIFYTHVASWSFKPLEYVSTAQSNVLRTLSGCPSELYFTREDLIIIAIFQSTNSFHSHPLVALALCVSPLMSNPSCSVEVSWSKHHGL